MKKILISFLCGIAFIIPGIVAAAFMLNYYDVPQKEITPIKNEQDAFTPDKNDWLKLMVTQNIRFTINAWEKRYHVTPIIYEDTKLLSIGITTPNGEEPITESEAAAIIPIIETIAKGTLDNYEWAKDYTVQVTVI